MTVGIPGTGIGGLFYLMLAIWMPFRELGLVLRGQSSLARWRFIICQLLLIAAMLGLMAAQGLLLRAGAGQICKLFPSSKVTQDLNTVVSSSSGLAMSALWISLSMLGCILLSVQIVRLFLISERTKRIPAVA